jgi:hypothetical protein
MVGAGLSDAVIINMLNTQPGKYFLGADDIIALKKAGVSGKIITAIVNKSGSGSSPALVSPAGVTGVGERSLSPDQPVASDSSAPVFRKVRWGMTKEQVKATESGRAEKDTPDLLLYVTKVGEYDPVGVGYHFVDDKLVWAHLYIRP